jgi:hypothetical protein
MAFPEFFRFVEFCFRFVAAAMGTGHFVPLSVAANRSIPAGRTQIIVIL